MHCLFPYCRETISDTSQACSIHSKIPYSFWPAEEDGIARSCEKCEFFDPRGYFTKCPICKEKLEMGNDSSLYLLEFECSNCGICSKNQQKCARCKRDVKEPDLAEHNFLECDCGICTDEKISFAQGCTTFGNVADFTHLSYTMNNRIKLAKNNGL